MFTRRRSLDRRRHYTREFLETLVARLTEAGFDRITIVLPHNYASVDLQHSEVEFRDFLQRERNFAAVILKAMSSQRNELLKILFVNSNARAIFGDDTFPMAESEPSGLFLQSPDPARAYALFEYFYEMLSSPSITRFVLLTCGAFLGGLVLIAEALALIGRAKGFLAHRFGQSNWWDVGIALAAAVVVFRFAATPTGLWVKPKRELRLLYLANMALKGELRDNPLVQLIMTVIAGLIVAFLAKMAGWL